MRAVPAVPALYVPDDPASEKKLAAFHEEYARLSDEWLAAMDKYGDNSLQARNARLAAEANFQAHQKFMGRKI